MKATRKNVFETNSSSTHSFTIGDMDDEELLLELDNRIVNLEKELRKFKETVEEIKFRRVDY